MAAPAAAAHTDASAPTLATDDSINRLRVATLRSVAVLTLIGTTVRFLSGADGAVFATPRRTAAMAFCIYILAFVNRNNATKLGMGLLVLGKAFATARAHGPVRPNAVGTRCLRPAKDDCRRGRPVWRRRRKRFH